jgi:hypothetical protein
MSRPSKPSEKQSVLKKNTADNIKISLFITAIPVFELERYPYTKGQDWDYT